jgi:hypothetical protein
MQMIEAGARRLLVVRNGQLQGAIRGESLVGPVRRKLQFSPG